MGYGRCEKDFGKGPVCYVDETSTCTDLVGSSNEPGKQYSWEACSSREFTDKISPSESLYFLLVSSYISIFKYSPWTRLINSNWEYISRDLIHLHFLGSPLLTDVENDRQVKDEDAVTQQDTKQCKCTTYVNKYGVGNCEMNEKRFEKNENVCYVSLPSSCPDLKKSNTDAGKFLSAVACRTNEKINDHLNSIITFGHYWYLLAII